MSSAIQNSEQLWHDPSFTLRRERARNMRFARARREPDGGEYVSAEAERERDAKYDRAHPKPKGNPEQATPKAFDANGEWLPRLASRISPRQSEQAHLLLENGLPGNARRQAWCGILARRIDCVENAQHSFLQRFRCMNRYCPWCGPLCFRELFAKHSRLIAVVEKLMQHPVTDHRPRVLAKLDITTKKLERMPTRAEVREFNRDVRKLFRAIEGKFAICRKDYGALWCCEFGRMNSNLHAHALYCGPKLPQHELLRCGKCGQKSKCQSCERCAGCGDYAKGSLKRCRDGCGLSCLWASIRADGSFIVSIKTAKSFEAALSHALKYPSKFFDAPASRLVDLEVAFHRVRRVHAVTGFYNPKIEREPGEDAGLLNGTCPICRGPLGEPGIREKRGWCFADELEREGRVDIEQARANPALRFAEHERRASGGEIVPAMGASP